MDTINLFPHVTNHQQGEFAGKRSAKLNVKASGREFDRHIDGAKAAYGLIAFAKAEGVAISPFALWFTDRESRDLITVNEATKRLKAAEAEGTTIEIEPEYRISRKGETYTNRYAGRIKVGDVQQPTKQAKPVSQAAAAFLKG